jgi:hypothetical protein
VRHRVDLPLLLLDLLAHLLGRHRHGNGERGARVPGLASVREGLCSGRCVALLSAGFLAAETPPLGTGSALKPLTLHHIFVVVNFGCVLPRSLGLSECRLSRNIIRCR